MQDYLNILEQMPSELRNPMAEFAKAIEDRMRKEFTVTRQDLTRLENIVAELARDQKETRAELRELAQAQKQTARIVNDLALEVKELRAAQAETARIVNDLALEVKELRAAQAETAQEVKELRAAQAETARIVHDLALGVKELRAAQAETAQEVKELRAAQAETARIVNDLALAQRQSESHMARLDRTVHAVGARWGIQSETSFREALSGILGDLGFKVERYIRQDSEGIVHGHPAQVELDVVIRDGKLILIEIKSSMSRSEVYTLERVATFYEKQENQKVDRKLIICPFLKPGAMEAAERLGIDVFTDVTEVS